MNLSTTGFNLAADSAIDLQLHTTYSDGRWTLEPLFDSLLRERFILVAITDHDRAERHHLLTSAGSDSHGLDKPPIKYRIELIRSLLERVGIQIK
jgi:histidinol phosphatase-like PHP family hydrolase